MDQEINKWEQFTFIITVVKSTVSAMLSVTKVHLRAFKPRSCRSPRVLPLALQHHGLEEQIMYTLHPENVYRVIYSQLKVSNIYTN